MNDLIPATYRCPTCGEENEVLIDPAGGPHQAYTEDCAVCCRPNALRISLSPEGDAALDVESEG